MWRKRPNQTKSELCHRGRQKGGGGGVKIKIWKRASEGDENRKSKKKPLGNENTKAEVQVVGVKQCHGRVRRRCAGKNERRFQLIENEFARERRRKSLQKKVRSFGDDSWNMGWVDFFNRFKSARSCFCFLPNHSAWITDEMHNGAASFKLDFWLFVWRAL